MTPATTVVISDPELLAKLAASDGLIVFRGPDGKCVRLAEPVPPGQLPAGIKSPFSDEEIEKILADEGGLPPEAEENPGPVMGSYTRWGFFIILIVELIVFVGGPRSCANSF